MAVDQFQLGSIFYLSLSHPLMAEQLSELVAGGVAAAAATRLQRQSLPRPGQPRQHGQVGAPPQHSGGGGGIGLSGAA